MLNGDYAKLREVIRRAHSLAGGKWKRGVTKQMSEETVELVRHGFATSTAPDGSKWAPVRRKGFPLLDSGRLRASILRASNDAGYSVFTNVVYARRQNYGGGGIRARAFFPPNGTCPPAWAYRLHRVARTYVDLVAAGQVRP